MGRIRSTATPERAVVYVVAPEIDQVLSNWGRWAGARIGARSASVSVLGRIALRGRSWDSAAPTSSGPAVDVDEAWRVEQCICHALFAPRHRQLLTQHYALRADQRGTCRTLHIQHQAYEAELWRAANYLWERFTRSTA